MEKHAYLVLAHKDDLTFHTLLSLLDDDRNDIFIHMDEKTKDYKKEATEALLSKSKVYHTKRTKVTWGGYSMIKAELLLLKLATATDRYQYYHLLSGEDLPIKSQDVIHKTFDELKGNELIHFVEGQSAIENRIRQYHLFQEKIGRNESAGFRYLEKTSMRFQRIIGVYRNKKCVFYYGAQWFSITDGFARYVLSKENWIRRTFRHTVCADEIFMQTLVMNSPFRDAVHTGEEYEAIYRLIDWKRGSPYVFKSEDMDQLQSSQMLFARKFDAAADSNIEKEIANIVRQR